jgi:hypothetical protein
VKQIIKIGGNAEFSFEYDFGNFWQQEVDLEQTMEPEPRIKYSCSMEAARPCPPDDVGGIWIHADFLKAISDPKNENHGDEARERRQADAKRFGLAEVLLTDREIPDTFPPS